MQQCCQVPFLVMSSSSCSAVYQIHDNNVPVLNTACNTQDPCLQLQFALLKRSHMKSMQNNITLQKT